MVLTGYPYTGCRRGTPAKNRERLAPRNAYQPPPKKQAQQHYQLLREDHVGEYLQ